MTQVSNTTESSQKPIGRNEPCTCGSGKKYKRCHGVDAKGILAPKNVATKSAGASDSIEENSAEAMMQNFDPSKMDMAWMTNFMTMMNRLPKGQMIRLQSLMRQAMAGKDVEREMAEFQRTLPKNFQELMAQAPTQALNGESNASTEGDSANAEAKPSRGFFKRFFKR